MDPVAIRLRYRQWGQPGSGLPVLLLHGHPGSGACMSVFGEALAPQLWSIAPDLRGYGQSQVRIPFGMADHLLDLEGLLRLLRVERYLVLGWSLGGILALELALRQPERVAGLILVASAARPLSDHPPISLWDQVLTGVASLLNGAAPGWEWNIAAFGRHSLYRHLIRQHTPQVYRTLAALALPAYLQTSAHAHQALQTALRQRYSRLEQISQIGVPTLVLAGSEDRHITAAASVETARALPQAQAIVYPDVAHLFPWEIPQRVQADLRGWLQQQGWYEPTNRIPTT